MLINRTVTKKILETIVHETFSQFGFISSSRLLDSLKLLGFHYATNAGISINIEDLKTPNVKKDFIHTANHEIKIVSTKWQQGFVSDTERFQTIIDSWNSATESLKNRIVDYYQLFDPANNLYIMAFSGARGNMSQVRQLVGMRGLMSDQEGKIIDLPIQANFREGLSSIDYIISSYGARKGIVDTALKTADSGYLTRRLIYIAQDLIIREENCKTKNGIIVILKKNTNVKNIIGRSLIDTKVLSSFSSDFDFKFSNIILTLPFLNQLKMRSPIRLKVRSPLTCKSNNSICQYCYGWDLAKNKIISLGETVGIIAAQSIGEPGTQLTMRTFHTGGIFTSESLKQIVSPFSGKIIIPKTLKTISYRTNHGILVLKLQQEVTLSILNWKGIYKEVSLEIGSYLYLPNSCFIKKGQLIAEYSLQSAISGIRKLKPIFTSFAGEIRFENLLVRKMLRDKRTIKINQDDGVLWIASGKIFPLPKEAKYKFGKKLVKTKPFATLKLISPYQGIVSKTTSLLSLTNNYKKIELNLLNLIKSIKNISFKFSTLVKDYQYIDSYTILGVLEFFPKYEGLIYSVRKKETKYVTIYFLITESDVWKINSDQVNNFSFFHDRKTVVRSGNILNNNSKLSNSGFFLKKDGFKMIFQNATPIFLSRGTILNYKQGDFVLEKKIFATLVNYTQQTEDIVQGLPKIEELIEARRPKIKAFLSFRPGILVTYPEDPKKELKVHRILKNNTIQCIYQGKTSFLSIKTTKKKTESLKKKQEKQLLHIGHSLFLKNNIIIYNNLIFKVFSIPSMFKMIQKDIKKNEFIFKCESNQKLLFSEKKISGYVWKKEKPKKMETTLFQYKYGKLIPWKTLKYDEKLKQILFKNKKNDFILQSNTNDFLYLEYLNPISTYEISLSSKILFQPGSFVDIGEPFTEGMIDIHQLLFILFEYHLILDGIENGILRSLHKFQLLLVHSIQSIYQSQGVNISSKHIEIIVKQMTSKVLIRESGDTPLLPGEMIRLSLITEIYKALKTNQFGTKYKIPKYEPILLSATNSSLSKDGFLSSAGFQETKRVLTKAAIEGSTDWLRGLKECIIIGRLIPAGSSFLNYKNYLDNVYFFKDI